jgi:hypothetical protein
MAETSWIDRPSLGHSADLFVIRRSRAAGHSPSSFLDLDQSTVAIFRPSNRSPPSWDRHGTLFMRGNGSGGIIYLKLGDQELEIAVFPKKPRR